MSQYGREKQIEGVTSPEPYVTIQAGLPVVERLAELGVLSAAELVAGREAGGLAVRLPAYLVEEFQQKQAKTSAAPTQRVVLPPLASPTGLSAEQLPVTLNPLDETAALERLAQRIDRAGLSSLARLFITSNRPLSFFASQILLLAQPVSSLALGAKDPTGRYSRLLEDRANLDWLLARLDELETARRQTKMAQRLGEKERK
ncbi:MAG: hypothetical protein HXX20_15165 [Chloroflexi bacterium]|nr:hypothetical protein [Chloroflexota bacterium]